MFHVCHSVMFATLWLPAGKELTSLLSCNLYECDVLLRFYHFPMWCLVLGVVLDCIDT